MANDKKVKIQFETKSDTKGAKDTKKAVDDVVKSEKQLDTASDQATNSIAGMRGEVTRLTNELERAEIGSEDFVSKARQLDSVQAKLDTTLRTSGAGFKNVGMLIGQAGFQVQDFAVQVGAGTSALTALSQQGSQLLGMFGPTGAVAGALLAIGAIAAKAFQEPEVEINQFFTNIEESARLAAQGVEEDLEEVIKSIDRNAQQAAFLATQYDGVREASDKYSQSELQNADKRREALQIINDLLGIQRDKLKELQDQQKSDADKRNLTTQQQISAQEEIARQSQLRVDNQSVKLTQDQISLENLRKELELQKQNLVVLRARRDLQEAQIRNAPSVLENASDAFFPNASISTRRAEAASSQSSLDAGSNGLLEMATKKFNETEESIKRLTENIASEGIALEQAASASEVAQANVATEIARLTEASKTEEILSAATDAKNTIETGSAEAIESLKLILAASEPANESQRRARDSIATAISDSIVTSNDAAKIAAELPILMKSISATNQKALDQVGVMINLMSILSQNQATIDGRLQLLERQISGGLRR